MDDIFFKYRKNPGYFNLSGAGRKRFWNLVKQGLHPDEALVAASKTWSALLDEGNLGGNKKLKRPIEEDPSIDVKPLSLNNEYGTNTEFDKSNTPCKIPKNICGDQAGSSASIKSTKFKPYPIFLAEIHNKKPMSEHQMNIVHKSLLLEIAKCEPATGPHFSECSQKAGYIHFICIGTKSQNWLNEIIPKIKPWPKADLSIYFKDQPLRVTTYLPSSEVDSVEFALELLQIQNKHIYVQDWKVLNEMKYKEGFVVTFALDNMTMRTLASCSFKVALGFKCIYFKILPCSQAKGRMGANKEGISKSLSKVESPATNTPVIEEKVPETGNSSMPQQEDINQKETEPSSCGITINDNSSNIQPEKSFNTLDESKSIMNLVEIHSKQLMTNEQMNMIHKLLISEITECQMGMGPRFSDFTHKAGWILVTCWNQYSRSWLMEAIEKMKPWPEADLYVTLPNPPLMAITFMPDSEVDTVEFALTLLLAQNKGLNVKQWTVLNVKKYQGGFVVSFTVDLMSIVILKKFNFKASLGFKSIFFKVLPYSQPNKEVDALTEDSCKSLNEMENSIVSAPAKEEEIAETNPESFNETKNSIVSAPAKEEEISETNPKSLNETENSIVSALAREEELAETNPENNQENNDWEEI